MNKILNHISWSFYLESFLLFGVIYYTFVCWKYYRTDIRNIINRLSGKTDDSNELPAALQYNPEEHLQSGKAAIAHPAHETADEEKFKGPAQSLVITLLACIEQATDKPFAPAILIPKLKRILNDHFDVATSPDRETNAKRGCRFLQNLQPLFITS